MLSEQQIRALTDSKTDKELKKNFKKITSEDPDKFFPTIELKNLGYIRKQCECCGTHFWTVHKDRKVCGDPVCSGGFLVTTNNPSKVKLSYIGVWEKIVEILEPRGYKPIKRYPCVARWNPTSEFTIASISAFQPYVITGEVEPPAKKLVIPQFCLRFNDIENVGVTSSHCTGFVMIGQHAFVSPEEWNQGELFMDIHDFIHIGVGLPLEEITIHEDSWAGGGSFGCSLEFFSRGVELFNQVYTMYEQTTEGSRELKLKVLDMGLGQERVTWFSQGTPNMYEAIFPLVLSRLRKITSIDLDLELYNKFSKYSAYLNVDEVEDMNAAWAKVAKELDMEVKTLKHTILPVTGLYSVAEHARTLLFAINDGKLPSNVGGGYNLRVIFRRAISFIDKFGWDVDISDVCEWHAEELKNIFPEVSDHLDEIREILDVEREKFYATKKEASKILEKHIKKGKVSVETLIQLYDSNGISPDMVKEAAKKYGIKVKIPDDFYSLVVERHEKQEQIHATGKGLELDLDDLPETESLYYYDYTKIRNKAKVQKIINNNVVLDKSVAYPTSGGQLHDIGTINNQPFSEVFKQGGYIIHVLKDTPKFKEGDVVEVELNKDWRYQLSQHHTATHIVNAAAREILGNHINQAGAKKTLKNSHLDITHYEQISQERLKEIEERANEIVNEGIDLHLDFIPRTQAEQRYGMGIYQGGAVPGKMVRIVEIPGIDVEACGGTHLNNTSETGVIKIIKSQKIQDGVVRLVFTAGEATQNYLNKQKQIIENLSEILSVEPKQIPFRVKELVEKWKNLTKSIKTGKFKKSDLELTSEKNFTGDIINKVSDLLNVKNEDIPKKVSKMLEEWRKNKTRIKNIEKFYSRSFVEKRAENAIRVGESKWIVQKSENLGQKEIQNISSNILKYHTDANTVFINETDADYTVIGMTGAQSPDRTNLDMSGYIYNVYFDFEPRGGGKTDYAQYRINKKDAKIKDLYNIFIKALQERKKAIE